MQKILLFLLSISMLVGCAQSNSETTETSACPKIVVTAHKEVSVEKLLAGYDMIRLEVTEQSLLKNILQLSIMNDKFYVVDSSAKFVFIFTLQGKYLGKICNQGQGPKEYIRIGYFETDPANNRLLLTDTFTKRLFEYDENGVLQKVLSLPFVPLAITSDNSGRYIHLASGDETYHRDNCLMNESYIHFLDSTGQVTRTLLQDETPRRLDIRSFTTSKHTSKGELLYMPYLSDKIYRLVGDKVVTEYEVALQNGYTHPTAEEKKELFYLFEKNNLEEAEAERRYIGCGTFLHSDSITFLSGGLNNPIFTYHSAKHNSSFSIEPKKLKGSFGLCQLLTSIPSCLRGDTFYRHISLDYAGYILSVDKTENKLHGFLKSLTEDDNPCIIAYRINPALFEAEK